jgi:hypothetical protein
MSDAKAIQGPYRINLRSSTTIETVSGLPVATCGQWGNNTRDQQDILEEQQANAHLLAASWEMREAIRFTLTEYGCLDDTEAFDRLSKALDNADGKE